MQIIEDLRLTRDETLRYFRLPEEQLMRRYAPGKWTIRQLLHHLADAETVYFDRIRRVLCERRQVLWAFDQDAWAEGLDYSQLPMDLSQNIYESVPNAIIHCAQLHYVRNGRLEFIHSETGVRTLKEEFDKVAAHNAHHLAQMQTARGEAF
jgi:DinB family protein